MKSYSTSVILETRRPCKDGTCPIKLRLIIDRKARYYFLGHHLTAEQWQAVMNPPPKAKQSAEEKQLRQTFIQAEQTAISLLKAMQNPNFDQFNRLFTQKGTGGNVVKYFDAYIKECTRDNRIGTASNYHCAKQSLQEVKNIETANFKDITPAWLKDYQNKMEAAGKSISTVGIYLRPLRFLYKRAISDGVISESDYPFGDPAKRLYQIPTSENNKRPLERAELETLARYTGNPIYELYRDYFVLSYYLVGLNFMDLLTIKWKQLNGQTLTIVRAKTKRTTLKKQKAINLYVNDQAIEIIHRHGNPDSVYVFNVVQPNDTPAIIRQKVQNFTRNTNQALKAIARATKGINPNISTVFARHSAASHGLTAGATIADISKALGHKNIQTTSNYISSLNEGIRQLGDSLLIDK